MRASDTGLQHPAAPHRNAGRLRHIVDALRLGEPAHAPQLNIDDAAGAHLNGLLGVVRGANTLVEANGGLQLGLQLRVVDDVVVRQRLFDHHQVVVVQLAQMVDIGKRVGGIRVHH